ncbi:unnamed protein product [marine sediment metagenome]|uniref:Glycosyltransferase 2-like domain-containing protein n=1 Tax=marine sediment metagenome TaxID=412755 RepID=X1S869_9ZZZZ
MRYDVIIPYYNNSGITKRCIESVIRHSRDYRIIVTFDDSRPEVVKIVEQILKSSEAYLHLINLINVGFPSNTNRGLKVSTGKFIAVINNDVIITGDWLTALENEYLRWGGKCFIGKAGKGVTKAGKGTASPTFPEVVKRY